MKTVLFNIISEKKIVAGFSELTIDPVETKKKIVPLLLEDPKIKRIGDLIIQQGTVRKAIFEIGKVISERKPPVSNKAERTQIGKYEEQIKDIGDELIQLEKYRKQKTDELKRVNTVYFDPSSREIIKSDEEIAALREKMKKLPDNYYLDVDGNEIPDFSEKKYWIKKDGEWEEVRYEFGEIPEPGAIPDGNLSNIDILEIAEQEEKKRVSELTPDEKEDEKKTAINKLSIRAVTRKQALEIQGVDAETAMTQAQEWYNAQVAMVEEKYT